MTVKECDLQPSFWAAIRLEPKDNKVWLFDNLAKMVAYMFSVDMPAMSDGKYRFTKESVKAIGSQLDGVSADSLEDGYIGVGTMQLLTNSPRCPYRMYANLSYGGSGVRACFNFVLKKDIVVPAGTEMPAVMET